MRPFLRPLTALWLALVLLLTAQGMAQARGQTMVAGQMVICAGTGVVTIQVDAEGNPVGPAHICPDCALSVLQTVAAPDAEFERLPAFRGVSFSGLSRPGIGQWDVAAMARGPPGAHGPAAA